MSPDIELTHSDKVNMKIAYLNILQNIINRMSTLGIAMQTASVTTLVALLTYAASTASNNFKIWMFIIPWMFFAGYNIFFLRTEKVFRELYDQSSNQHDFSFTNFKINKKILTPIYEKSENHWVHIAFSKTLCIFHFSILIVIITSALIKGIPCF